ncbi:MAG TPA: selenide, water dikinase SelD [Solirubrobacteraceae bacterium]|nr:selenide, water dikinase SelD [Solirubrobacteraceae bacterium]
MSRSTLRLTSLARGAGCGCKLPAADLHELLGGLDLPRDERVLVGIRTGDDAAVVRLGDRAEIGQLALVQTVDFFTPIVDDPRAFGAIAAANALSDVYAMGGTPLSALSIVGFPLERLGGEVLRAILDGALGVLAEAGALLVGGHSIDDPEPKFGLAVTGTIDPARMLSNSGAREGDAIVLTKPLGTGAIATVAKHGEVSEELLARAIEVMSALNEHASRCALAAGAHAAADVTGFGLLGHLHAIARESGLAAEVNAAAVPALPGAAELLQYERGVSGGTRRTAQWAAAFTSFAADVPAWRRWLLADATTSGGLLVAVPPDRASELPGPVIGRMAAGPAGAIQVS